jgi:hypothetical protein
MYTYNFLGKSDFFTMTISFRQHRLARCGITACITCQKRRVLVKLRVEGQPVFGQRAYFVGQEYTYVFQQQICRIPFLHAIVLP